MGRLADGATIEQVEPQMNAVAMDLEQQFPDANSGLRVELMPAATFLTRNAKRVVSILGLAAIAIFLLACTNIASLLLVRTAGRQAELSVRTALGASASRLSRQLLIEHLVLAGDGRGCGGRRRRGPASPAGADTPGAGASARPRRAWTSPRCCS